MKKEVILAIIAGSAFGLAIAFGIWRVTSVKPKITNNDFTPVTETSIPSATDSPVVASGDNSFKVILQKPLALSVLTDTPTVVSGVASPNSWVVVTGEDNDEIINASNSGEFSANIDLTGGINQIGVSAFASDGTRADANFWVTYSSQFAKDANQTSSPTSYIGTVTDITNSVIQIKNDAGDIEQIAGAANTTYVDTRNDNVKTIKSTDLAIGDFLIGMGYKDGNNILNATRIIVAEKLVKTTRTAFYGTVTDDSGYNKFVAKNSKTGETVTVAAGTGVAVSGIETSFGKISNDEKVIVAGDFKDGTLTARTIQVMK